MYSIWEGAEKIHLLCVEMVLRRLSDEGDLRRSWEGILIEKVHLVCIEMVLRRLSDEVDLRMYPFSHLRRSWEGFSVLNLRWIWEGEMDLRRKYTLPNFFAKLLLKTITWWTFMAFKYHYLKLATCCSWHISPFVTLK